LYVSSCQRSLFPLLGLRTRLSFFRVLFFCFGSAKLQLFSQLPNFFVIFYASGKTET
jgi:hypothetical protein